MKMNTYFQLLPKLRMHVTIPVLPVYAFMEWTRATSLFYCTCMGNWSVAVNITSVYSTLVSITSYCVIWQSSQQFTTKTILGNKVYTAIWKRGVMLLAIFLTRRNIQVFKTYLYSFLSFWDFVGQGKYCTLVCTLISSPPSTNPIPPMLSFAFCIVIILVPLK